MSALHYVVVVGATQALSDVFVPLANRPGQFVIVAPAVKKHERGITQPAIEKAIGALLPLVQKTAMEEYCRLSVWAYQPRSAAEIELLWRAFGRSAWIEFIPATLADKVQPTRSYIENRLKEITPLLHEVSHYVFAKRKGSPLPIPVKNFRSKALISILGRWYAGLDLVGLKKALQSITERFRQSHTKKDPFGHLDDRGLLFAPAGNEACHGMPHPIGASARCYVEGRFRFGAALFPGFHYDTRASSGNLTVLLSECEGEMRDMRAEKRDYINIFPNEHLLPGRP